MILFIDEADAFLRNRKDSDMSESMRHTINCFLYRTGSPSEKVVIVMATNSPEQLDEAVHDRIDEVVGFNVPTLKDDILQAKHLPHKLLRIFLGIVSRVNNCHM